MAAGVRRERDPRPRAGGPGGFAQVFEGEGLFDEIVPELVLLGLQHAEQLNRDG